VTVEDFGGGALTNREHVAAQRFVDGSRPSRYGPPCEPTTPNRNPPVVNSVAEENDMTDTVTVTATNRHATFTADKAAAVLEAYQAEGVTHEKDGVEKLSSTLLGERVRDVLIQRAVVRNKSEVQTNAIEPADLAGLVFSGVPDPASPDYPDEDDDSDEAEITRHVWKGILGAVSKAAQTGRKGSVQRLLAADPATSKLIVCSTKIGKNPKKAVYLSADKDMIMLGLAMPRTTRLSTLSAEMADDFKFAIEQNSSLKKPLNERLETGLKAARDTARAKLALTSGEEDES
jgi:hypothetical protein